MNYIELINNMWSLREQGLLTAYECDLYLYLVHRSNRLGWKNPFTQPTDITCAVLGINRNALLTRRSRLRQLGLISFKGGERKTKPPTYTICNPCLKQPSEQAVCSQHLAQPAPTKSSTPAIADYGQVVSVFNQRCPSLSKVQKLSPKRIEKLDEAIRQFGLEKLFECFSMVEASHFLSKRKGKWKATFDWIIEPDNTAKILEGSYGNEAATNSPTHSSGAGEKEYGAGKWAEAAAEIEGGTA